jgi:hypothetical protein
VLLEAGARTLRHVGAFYVLTNQGTMYWLHPMNDQTANFLIETSMFVIEGDLVWEEIWINDYDRFVGFNPERCS